MHVETQIDPSHPHNLGRLWRWRDGNKLQLVPVTANNLVLDVKHASKEDETPVIAYKYKGEQPEKESNQCWRSVKFEG